MQNEDADKGGLIFMGKRGGKKGRVRDDLSASSHSHNQLDKPCELCLPWPLHAPRVQVGWVGFKSLSNSVSAVINMPHQSSASLVRRLFLFFFITQ